MILALPYLRAMFGTFFSRLRRDERGASLVEYGLLLALISVVCIAAVTALGKSSAQKFNDVKTSVECAGVASGVNGCP